MIQWAVPALNLNSQLCTSLFMRHWVQDSQICKICKLLSGWTLPLRVPSSAGVMKFRNWYKLCVCVCVSVCVFLCLPCRILGKHCIWLGSRYQPWHCSFQRRDSSTLYSSAWKHSSRADGLSWKCTLVCTATGKQEQAWPFGALRLWCESSGHQADPTTSVTTVTLKK